MLPEGFKLKNEEIFKRELPKLVLQAIENNNSSTLFEYLCNSEEATVEFICLAESFERPSKIFKTLTRFHDTFMKANDKRYLKYYHNVSKIADTHKTKWLQELYPELNDLYPSS